MQTLLYRGRRLEAIFVELGWHQADFEEVMAAYNLPDVVQALVEAEIAGASKTVEMIQDGKYIM